MSLAHYLADKYVAINLDDASPIYREAFSQFQQGHLDSAQRLINSFDLDRVTTTILAEGDKISDLQKELNERDSRRLAARAKASQLWRLKADFHKTRFQYDSVVYCYNKLFSLDSLNITDRIDFAKYLMSVGEISQSLLVNSQALQLHPGDYQKAVLLHNLGVIFREENEFAPAESNLLAAKDLYEKIQKNISLNLSENLA